MKINWGFKIAFFYSAFVVFIIGMIFLAFGENFDLVTEDYYQKELEFQDKIDKSSNAKLLETKLQVSIVGKAVQLTFPRNARPVEGEIMFFRPDNEKDDFIIQLKKDSNIQQVDLERFRKGKYLVKIDWKSNDKSYYQENTIIIP